MDVEREKYKSKVPSQRNSQDVIESSQQAVIREGFLEELLPKQLGGDKGGQKPLTQACIKPVMCISSQCCI